MTSTRRNFDGFKNIVTKVKGFFSKSKAVIPSTLQVFHVPEPTVTKHKFVPLKLVRRQIDGVMVNPKRDCKKFRLGQKVKYGRGY